MNLTSRATLAGVAALLRAGRRVPHALHFRREGDRGRVVRADRLALREQPLVAALVTLTCCSCGVQAHIGDSIRARRRWVVNTKRGECACRRRCTRTACVACVRVCVFVHGS